MKRKQEDSEIDMKEKQVGNSVSRAECVCWRILNEEHPDYYTKTLLAFMFETRVPTVAKHINEECHHDYIDKDEEESINPHQKHTSEEMLTAFRIVNYMVPYQKMSQQLYDEERPDDFPSSSAIMRRFGGWPDAREKALENSYNP